MNKRELNRSTLNMRNLNEVNADACSPNRRQDINDVLAWDSGRELLWNDGDTVEVRI